MTGLLRARRLLHDRHGRSDPRHDSFDDVRERSDHHAGPQAQRRFRAGRREQDRPCGPALRRGPRRCRTAPGGHPHHLGAVRRRHNRGARRALHSHGGVPHRRGAELFTARRPPAQHLHRQGSAEPGRLLVQPVDRPRPTPRLGGRQCRRARGAELPQAQRRDPAGQQRALRVLRLAHRVRPLPAAPPERAQGHRNPAVLLPSRRVWACPEPRGSHSLLPAHRVARVPAIVAHAVQFGHRAPANVELLPARFTRG